MDVILQRLIGVLLVVLEVLGILRTDIRPLEISDEDPLEVCLVTDVVVWEEFKPRPNMFPHADGEILNDEKVIIHLSGSAGEPEIFEPNARVRLPGVLGDVGGRSEALWNGALWMRRPKARGPGPSGLGLWSSGRRPCLGRVSPLPSMVRSGPMSHVPITVRWTLSSCWA